MEKKHSEKHKKLLHDIGLKATKDRVHILKILEKKKCPLSVHDIEKKAKKTNIVTIYRFLEVLKEKGIVRQVNIDDERKHFEIATSTHHHHIVCEKCGFVEKIEECELDKVIKRQVRSCKRFSSVTDHTFEIHGVCKKCK